MGDYKNKVYRYIELMDRGGAHSCLYTTDALKFPASDILNTIECLVADGFTVKPDIIPSQTFGLPDTVGIRISWQCTTQEVL